MVGLKVATAIHDQHYTSLILSWFEVVDKLSVSFCTSDSDSISRPQINLFAFITMTARIRAMEVCLGKASKSNNTYLALDELENVNIVDIVIIIITVIIIIIVTVDIGVITIVNSNTNNTCRQGRVSSEYPTRSSPT